MIKIENTSVMNLDNAIRGMRNPLNSWDLSDSYIDEQDIYGNKTVLGEKDLDLIKRLTNAGPSHRKVLRQILVCMDITAPLYWWKEFDTYKISTVSNSCSTMHKIHSKKFDWNDFSTEHLITETDNYDYILVMEHTIEALNNARSKFLETKDKKYWWQMIQLLPSSYNQKRTITCNYETLLNIYETRKDHKLDEWHEVCDWILHLPYTKELFLH